MRPPNLIAVIGTSSACPEEYELAERVGTLLAKAGAVVVCGGASGIMEAACRGAKASGGTTIGILPGENPCEANDFVDIPIATGMGEMRNALIIRACRAAIAIGGGPGTLSEIALAAKAGKLVVGLRTFEISLGGELQGFVLPAQNPEQAVQLALGTRQS